MRVKNFLAYVYFIVFSIGLELAVFKPDFFWTIFILEILFTIFTIWYAFGKKNNKDFLNYLISPLLFALSGILFLAFLGYPLFKHLLILFLALTNSIFIQSLINFTYSKDHYKEHSLSSVSRIINLSTIFFWYSASFELYAFLKVSNWLLIPAGIIITYLVTYQFFCISKIKNKIVNTFILVITLILFELSTVIGWLPFLSAVKGLLVASIYYFTTSLSKYDVGGLLAKSVYLRYSLVTLIIWVSALLTARWQ